MMTPTGTWSFETDSYPAQLMSDLTTIAPPDAFGQKLHAEPLGLGPSTDVWVSGDTIFALVAGGLSILRETIAGPLQLVGRLEGLRPTRQLAIEGTTAVVTMREGGMAVIDLSDLRTPRLAAWHDTIEYATGVALSAGRAYITNRHYGVEIVDVGEPAHPRPLGWLRCGEAQSVTVHGHIACVGAWRDRKLVVADVSDPHRPVVIGIAELDGYADGVAIHADHCYVATGHHASGIDGFPYEDRDAIDWEMLQQGYGRGHGIEIFDLADPANPRRIHGLKTPPALSKSPDSWRVVRQGRYLLHADSVNGVFVLDLSSVPTFLGHTRIGMPSRPPPKAGPSLQERAEPIIGIALSASGTIYASGAETDLYRISSSFRSEESVEAAQPHRAPSTSRLEHHPRAIFQGEGLVHAVVADDDMLVVAAGTDGLVGLSHSGNEIFRQPFARGARDVVRDGENLVVAAGHQGLALLRIESGGVVPAGSLGFPDPVRFVARVRPGLVLAVTGSSGVALVDVVRPDAPRVILNAKMTGNVYGRQVVDGLIGGRFAAALSQTGGFRWIDVVGHGDGPVAGPATGRRSCPITEGAAFVGDRALVVRLGGYYLLAPGEEVDPREAISIRLDEGDIIGAPTIAGGLLLATNRVSGLVQLIDIASLEAPRSIGRVRLDGQIGRPALHGPTLYVPAGHAGLIALQRDDIMSHKGVSL